VFRRAHRRRHRLGIILAVIGGVNSVIALYYYANVAKEMWLKPVPDGDARRSGCRPPQLVGHFTDFTDLPVLVAQG
jgi:NADH:ubiquinone oxidoreductase subunit 2 (subunit N)